MNKFCFAFFLLTSCGKALPYDVTYEISNTVTTKELALIQEVLEEFSIQTGIQLKSKVVDHVVEIWKHEPLAGISISPECTEENLCIALRDGKLQSCIGYQTQGSSRSIFLISLDEGWGASCRVKDDPQSEVRAMIQFRVTVMHELGHAYGLDHTVQGSGDIMQPGHGCNYELNYERRTEFYSAVRKANPIWQSPSQN